MAKTGVSKCPFSAYQHNAYKAKLEIQTIEFIFALYHGF